MNCVLPHNTSCSHHHRRNITPLTELLTATKTRTTTRTILKVQYLHIVISAAREVLFNVKIREGERDLVAVRRNDDVNTPEIVGVVVGEVGGVYDARQ